MSKEAPFGWTVCRNNAPKARKPYMVYKRDCPATGLAADLAPFTHPTAKAADEAGKAGNYAYKR